MSKGLVSQWFSGLGCFSTPKCYECILLPNLLWRTGSITRRDCKLTINCGGDTTKLDEMTFERNLEKDLKSHESRFKVSVSVASRNMLKTQRGVKYHVSLSQLPTATEKIHINIQRRCLVLTWMCGKQDSKKSTSHESDFPVIVSEKHDPGSKN